MAADDPLAAWEQATEMPKEYQSSAEMLTYIALVVIPAGAALADALREARTVAERDRDENHRQSCAAMGHDPEKSSKLLLPWEGK
jgi:hypothetical protein